MNNNDFTSEFGKIEASELNDDYVCEDNFVQNITNPDNISTPNFSNNNHFDTGQSLKKKNKSKHIYKLMSSFLVVCVFAAIMQSTFYIPIFSDIVGMLTTVATPKEPILPVYKITDTKSTHEIIGYTIIIENIENYFANEYAVILVQSGDDDDKTLSTFSASTLLAHKKVVTEKSNSGTFSTYISSVGIQKLQPSKNYVILLLKDGKIVQKCSISTTQKPYLSEINAYFTAVGINIKLKTHSSFTGYGTLLIQVKNLTNPTWGPEGNGIDWTTGSEATLAESTFLFAANKLTVDQEFELKIFCVTTDPEKIALPDTIYHGDYYYLIYTYDKPLILKGE